MTQAVAETCFTTPSFRKMETEQDHKQPFMSIFHIEIIQLFMLREEVSIFTQILGFYRNIFGNYDNRYYN